MGDTICKIKGLDFFFVCVAVLISLFVLTIRYNFDEFSVSKREKKKNLCSNSEASSNHFT